MQAQPYTCLSDFMMATALAVSVAVSSTLRPAKPMGVPFAVSVAVVRSATWAKTEPTTELSRVSLGEQA